MWIALVVALIVGAVMLEFDGDFVKFVFGAAAGGLSILVFNLHSKLTRQSIWIANLEKRLEELSVKGTVDSEAVRASAAESQFEQPAIPIEASLSQGKSEQDNMPPQTTSEQDTRHEATDTPDEDFFTVEDVPEAADWVEAPAQTPGSKSKPEPDPFEVVAVRWVKRWLTTGNVPVKVGVLISFFGVSFLFKYAAEQNYLHLSIPVRLGAVALAAMGALVFGWLQREKKRAFALSLQGGAIGVLFLTVFAAFRLYDLMPPLPAFVLLIVFTAITGVLAIIQNAMALAVLGVVGGFLAPVLISTGSGSHVALFSYYAVLNGVIFGVSWLRTWRVLNVIGFVFTFIIATAWGYRFYQPEFFATVQPFLALYFIMYLGISMAYALGRSVRLKSYIDSTLVFGLPLIVYPLQTQLVHDFEYGTAISAAALAAIYLMAAVVLLCSRLRERVRMLGEAYIALAVGFATLAVPLALSAHWTAFTWVLEGAAMVWIGTRQERKLSTIAGIAMQLLAGASLVYSLNDGLLQGQWLFANTTVLCGLLLALAGVASARWLEPLGSWFNGAAASWTWALFGWGLVCWFAIVWHDIARFVDATLHPASWVALLSVTATLLCLGQVKWPWQKVRAALSGYLPVLFLTALGGLSKNTSEHYFAHFGWLAWPLAVLTLLFVFCSKNSLLQSVRPWQRSVCVWLSALILAREFYWLTSLLLPGGVWANVSIIVVAIAIHLVVWQLWQRSLFGIARHSDNWSKNGVGPLLGVAALVALAMLLTNSGDPSPIIYVPLLNPLDIAACAVALAVVHWLRVNALLAGFWGQVPAKRFVGFTLCGVGLILLSGNVTRAVHNWTGVAFTADALFASVKVQAGISVVWALSALTAMVVGHRRAGRNVYLCGAALMVVVVAKLFLVDLSQSGTLERIVSFIGVGLLLLVVGFLAPVPPKLKPNTV
ncbi:DUF2339 domain-containing protein [Gilvimarinus sp. SDUM040013]|uniref:DUF2339 domain-containing protein n=1 Tax=Gilvimarinus gilvus TaxID=3058038 RepID=A0ABU4RW94_9GAMM|nr:DUF2339 domain-containing protein [Gilvimarinus sp. SDUM040013]MDO3386573.1 DUF2339 domain-containing protein [Gilvimarinus sp. SDUM040013]MDX6849149.1 DUF2339 domain-containing protein [Gilvimarinus sp. SDUM040013]